MLWTRPEHGDRSVEEEARQSDEVQPRYRGRQPLVILDQPPKARRQHEIAPHHPPPRQKHEAPLGLQPLDNLQPNTVLFRCLGRLLPGVPLVYAYIPRQNHKERCAGPIVPSRCPCWLRRLANLKVAASSRNCEEPTSGLEPMTSSPVTSDRSGVAGVCRG